MGCIDTYPQSTPTTPRSRHAALYLERQILRPASQALQEGSRSSRAVTKAPRGIQPGGSHLPSVIICERGSQPFMPARFGMPSSSWLATPESNTQPRIPAASHTHLSCAISDHSPRLAHVVRPYYYTQSDTRAIRARAFTSHQYPCTLQPSAFALRVGDERRPGSAKDERR